MVARRGTGIGEGGVEVDGGDARAAVIPVRIVGAAVQVEGRACAARTVGVVAERQFRAVGRQPGVGRCRCRCCRVFEISALPLVPAGSRGVLLRSEAGGIGQRAGCGARAQVDACRGVPVGSRGRDGQRLHGRAVLQHALRFHGRPEGDAREVEAGQGRAAGEGEVHRRRLRRAQAAQREAGEGRISIEHVVHRRHQRGVEGAHVEARQAGAATEHGGHVRHLGGVEVLHVGDVGEARHPVEPVVARRRTGIGEGGVEHGACDPRALVIPARIVGAAVQVVGRARAAGTLVIVAEGQFRAVGRQPGVHLILMGGRSFHRLGGAVAQLVVGVRDGHAVAVSHPRQTVEVIVGVSRLGKCLQGGKQECQGIYNFSHNPI